jgi:class 3 adenylate cyclase/tetratricopeptide (TPR) repeat protein
MICANCGTENREGRKFCSECAAPLAVACPSCGAANQPGEKFCGECASPLHSDAGAASVMARPVAPATGGSAHATPLAERRLVSVLFTDLVGFTPFAEEKDPEEVRELLSRYFDLASDVIRRYGGTVEKFIGDAVMAVWGAPVAQEDDAERAVRAALELADAVRSLGPAIQARCGVLTGEAAVTVGATNEGLVAGDLVNTAARLQSVAPPGTVLVGDATMRATSAAIGYEEAGEQVLKGKAAPVPAWRATRVVAERGGRGRSDLPEPPFVGRDEELRLLKDLLTATGRDRRSRLVSVTGPGGIGKSRLAWELEKYADGVTDTIYWHRGRSPSYGEGISFWALGEMVRRRAGLAEDDDEATTRARIAETVATYVPAEDDRRWVEPALLALLGLEPSPSGGRDVLFAAWRIFFERISDAGTTVLLFEDLQWADSGLLDFIETLLTWARTSPILVITLARPELFDRRPAWGSSARSLTTIALEPLSDEAMRALLEGFVPGLPDGAMTAILDRADGIPLYGVEMVRSLVAAGRLTMVEGSYRPTGDLGELTIPDSLRSLIASRLDTLDPSDRTLVETAAVLGQTFTVDGLSAVTGEDLAALESRLAGLVRRELLSIQTDPRSPERGQYAFVQSLIREVAYGTLARRERRERHLAVARWYESVGDDELAGALATHYVEAFRASAGGAEADAVAVQARIALRAAAERAESLGAHDQAISHLRQALELTSDPRDRGELFLRTARAASQASKHTEAEAAAREAAAAFDAAGDRASTARARAQLGAALLDASRVAEAQDVLNDLVARLDADVDPVVEAEILANLSRALMRADETTRAIEIADRGLAIAERHDLDRLVAELFNNKAASLGYLGRRREAVALMEAAIRVAQGGGHVAAELRALANLGSVAGGDDARRARQVAIEAFDLARRVGNRMMANWLVSNVMGSSFVAAADWDRALAEGEEILAAADDPADRGRILSFLTLLRLSRGEPVDEALVEIEAMVAKSSDPSDAQFYRILRANRAFYAGEFDRAYDEAIAAADLFTSYATVCLRIAYRSALAAGALDRARRASMALDDRMDSDADARLLRAAAHAGIDALEGREPDAIEAYRRVIRARLELGTDLDAAQEIMTLVRLVGADDPRVRSMVDEARAIFERVGARPLLDQLEAAIAGPPVAPIEHSVTPRVDARDAGSVPGASPLAGR